MSLRLLHLIFTRRRTEACAGAIATISEPELVAMVDRHSVALDSLSTKEFPDAAARSKSNAVMECSLFIINMVSFFVTCSSSLSSDHPSAHVASGLFCVTLCTDVVVCGQTKQMQQHIRLLFAPCASPPCVLPCSLRARCVLSSVWVDPFVAHAPVHEQAVTCVMVCDGLCE
jgi:hypothetical protein